MARLVRNPKLAILASRRSLVPLALVIAIGIGIAVWPRQEGGASPAAASIVSARRGDLVISVGGVGRIVEGTATGQIALPSTTGSSGAATSTTAPSGTASGGSASVPADAVLPHTSGRVARLLVAQGRHVVAGAPLALLDDGGAAAAAVAQAENELATAKLELAQKRTSDPLTGLPPTHAELAAARVGVSSARERLALLGHPRPADVSAAKSDLKRAKADLETLRGGTPGARARAVAIAQQNVQVAQDRLDTLLAGPSAADVAAAEAELKKTEADLEALVRSDRTQPVTQKEIDAAKAAIEAARQKLAKVQAGPDPAELSAARLELERAQAELQTLEAGPSATARAAAEQAVAASRARLRQLLGAPIRTDVTAARLDVRKAVADLAVLRARGGPGSRFDIGLASLKIQAAEARLALASFAVGQLTVRTPWAGTVTGVLTVPGAPVDTTTPVATVADLRHLAVSVDLSEFDVAQVKPGQQAIVSVDALGGKRFSGKVLFEALTGVDNGGVVTFPVRIGLPHVAGVKPGMNVSVRIIVESRHAVVQVPLEAIGHNNAGRPIVTLVDTSGGTSSRRVTLGLANNKDVEIVHGLRAGARVQLAGGKGA